MLSSLEANKQIIKDISAHEFLQTESIEFANFLLTADWLFCYNLAGHANHGTLFINNGKVYTGVLLATKFFPLLHYVTSAGSDLCFSFLQLFLLANNAYTNITRESDKNEIGPQSMYNNNNNNNKFL